MRQITLIAISAFSVLLAYARPAHALFFSDFIDFDGPGLGPGDAGAIDVADNAPPPAWLHDILGEIAPEGIGNIQISDARLTVSYRRTNGSEWNGPEDWTLFGDGNLIAPLLQTGFTILTTDFPLNAAALAALQSDGQLNILPLEFTQEGRDHFSLYQSTLSGNYRVHPNPEPSSLFLIGSGLFGLLTRRRIVRK